MNKSEHIVIKNCIARLRAKEGGSPHIHKLLLDPQMRSWLDTWVVGALELLVKEDRDLADLNLALRLSA